MNFNYKCINKKILILTNFHKDFYYLCNIKEKVIWKKINI
ncbi:hypothetical protein DAC20_45 [Bacteroides phage DAC20]|nr:hypothetical protein DAC19_46 [Bacteroides phage DAC19]QIG63798.1 hypothetical protein DAC20_45 [Bacteroides phage DAC20]QIG64059.1 hypothetical protein DAC22_45 [Bacteroides phage DAC22]QIG64320.1 hypothetical protein DAC23_42 [Bacteroides phage DAC23]